MYNLKREVNKKLRISFVYSFGCSNHGQIFNSRDIDGNINLNLDSKTVYTLSPSFKFLSKLNNFGWSINFPECVVKQSSNYDYRFVVISDFENFFVRFILLFCPNDNWFGVMRSAISKSFLMLPIKMRRLLAVADEIFFYWMITFLISERSFESKDKFHRFLLYALLLHTITVWNSTSMLQCSWHLLC